MRSVSWTTRVGNAIAAARRERGWAVDQLAERSGYAVSGVKDIESGRHLPRAGTLLDIAQALGVKSEPLLLLRAADRADRAQRRGE